MRTVNGLAGHPALGSFLQVAISSFLHLEQCLHDATGLLGILVAHQLPSAVGTICQENPNLSLSHPHWLCRPPRCQLVQ